MSPPIAAFLLLLMITSPNFRLKSCWSKAGVGTSIVLQFKNQNHKGPIIVLDLGATPCYEHSLPASTVLLSHGHIDHMGAIFSHARAHALLLGGSIPTYYAPAEIVPLIEQARQALTALDAAGSTNRPELLKMNIVGVHPGQEIQLKRPKHTHGIDLFVRVFGVSHNECPAVGYVIGTRHPPVLKEEFKGRGKEDIQKALANGISIKTEPIEVLEVAYTGDTSIKGLTIDTAAAPLDLNSLHLKQAFQCPLFLCETSFLFDLDKEKDLAEKRGHVHIMDLAPLLQEQVDTLLEICLLHISARYNASQALEQIIKVLPARIKKLCSVAIVAHSGQAEDWAHLIQDNGCVSLAAYESWSELQDS